MKPISPIIILTAVVLALVSPSLAFAIDCNDKGAIAAAETAKKDLEEQIQAIDDDLRGVVRQSGQKPTADELDKRNNLNKLRKQKVSIDTDLQKCIKETADKKEDCKTWEKERKELLDKFPSGARVAAQLCVKAYEDGEGEMANALMAAMINQSAQGIPQCELGAAKTTNKDKTSDLTKEIDKLESGVRKTDESIIKKQESSQNELERIEKARDDAKRQYEESKEEAENAQVKALSDLRNQQSQMAKSIRELRTQELVERQQITNIQSRLKFAMSFAKPLGNEKSGTVNLRSEVSILNHCKKEAKASVGTGKSANGASRAQQARDQIMTCIEGLREQRKNTETASMQELEQRNNRLSEIHEQINSGTQQLEQLTTSYNDAIKRLYEKMTKAQQAYFKADSDLANKYNAALQRAQQEQSRLQTEKMQDQMKIMGKYNSQGKLSNQDAQEIIDTATDLDGIENNMKEHCPAHKNLQLTSGKVDSAVKNAVDKAEDSQQ